MILVIANTYYVIPMQIQIYYISYHKCTIMCITVILYINSEEWVLQKNMSFFRIFTIDIRMSKRLKFGLYFVLLNGNRYISIPIKEIHKKN